MRIPVESTDQGMASAATSHLSSGCCDERLPPDRHAQASRGMQAEGGQALALQMAPALRNGGLSTRLNPALAGRHTLLRHMLELEADGRRVLIRLRKALRPLPGGVAVPRGELGQQVALALRLIGSGAAPAVIQMAQGGYDTHANQEQRHRRVLTELAGAHGSPCWRRANSAGGWRRMPRRAPTTAAPRLPCGWAMVFPIPSSGTIRRWIGWMSGGI